jgi:alanine dehydrogenase
MAGTPRAVYTQAEMIRLLTEHDVARALEGVDLVALMADALQAFSSRAVVQPTRTVLSVGPDQAFFGVMPAWVPGRDALGAKLVSVFARNLDRGLPTHAATVLLFDAGTGALAAVLDGRYITEVRTAAVSVLAAETLAAGPIRRVAVFGCGVQARSHIRLMAARWPALEQVRAWSPLDDREPFADAMRAELGGRLAIDAGAGPDATARDADLVVLVTSATEPVLARAWVRPGTLVIAVGACRPSHRELDPALVAGSRVFVDSRDAALAESGDIVCGIAEGRFGPAHLRGELGEVLLGRVAVREAAGDVVIFKSLGLAVEDVTVADVACRRALETGLGTTWSF